MDINLNQYKSRPKAKWIPSIMTPQSGQQTNTITRLTNEFLAEMSNPETRLPDFILMARKDPVVRSCIEIKCLRASLMLGRYVHHDPKIQRFIQDNLDNIQGCLSHTIGRLASAMPLGYSCAEIVFTKERKFDGLWRLKHLNIMDQTRTSFEGKSGNVTNALYVNGDGKKIKVPYFKVLHVVNGYSANISGFDSVYGDPESAPAYPYYKAKQAILAEMMISAKQNASGLWLGKADSNKTVQVADSQGRPTYNTDGTPKIEPAMLSLLRQMLNIENNSVIVTDLENQIQPLHVDAKEGFWSMALNLLDGAIMRSYCVPKMVFEEGSGSFGMNGIGKQHQLLMDAQITSIVKQIRDQILEKVVKPLLIWNFGVTKDFGSFALDPVEDPDAKNMLINNIMMATGSQLLQASDIIVQNKVRQLIGLPEITEQEQYMLNQSKLLADYMQTVSYQGTPPALYAEDIVNDMYKLEAQKQSLGLPSQLAVPEEGAEEPGEATEEDIPAENGQNPKNINPQNAPR